LRFNFVVAAHLVSALHSSVFARLASGAFYEIIKNKRPLKEIIILIQNIPVNLFFQYGQTPSEGMQMDFLRNHQH